MSLVLYQQRGGDITCKVTGNRQYSCDLPQGGLELPCKLTFCWPNKEIAKVKHLLQFASSNNNVPSVKCMSPVVFAASFVIQQLSAIK